MGKRLTQQEAEERVLNKCKEKNYTLLEPFIYNIKKTKIHLKCNIDNYDWTTTYNCFYIQKSGCPKCNGNVSYTQIEAEKLILYKCKEMNYDLLETFIYKNTKNTYLHIKCNIDNYDWYPVFYNFLKINYKCPKCVGISKPTQIEAENRVLKKCKEKNYELIEPFIYVDNKKTILKLKCLKDNNIWQPTYNNFINHDNYCSKCKGVLKPTQIEAENRVLKKCKEKNYELIEPFIYVDNKKTILKLKCLKDNNIWQPTYNNFINHNRGCAICKSSKSEYIISTFLKNKNIKYKTEHKFNDCILKNKLRFDFYLPEQNICIEYDGKQHYEINKYFGGEVSFLKTQQRDKIKTEYCQNNNIKLIRIRYDENINEILDKYF